MIYIVKFHVEGKWHGDVETECCECGSTIYKETDLVWDKDVEFTVIARDPDDAWEAAIDAFTEDHCMPVKVEFGEVEITNRSIEPIPAAIESEYFGHMQLFPLAHYGPAATPITVDNYGRGMRA